MLVRPYERDCRMWYETVFRVFLFLACVFACGGSAEYLNQGLTKKNRVDHPEDLALSHHVRVRRRVSGFCNEESQCTGNRTVMESRTVNNCYCDHACFKIFSDCCPDYERHCGRQESLSQSRNSVWKCVEFPWSPVSPCVIEGVTGVWMIQKCPDSYSGELKTKCENAPSEFSYPVGDFIPVVGANALTYRNKHCALCNGVQDYTAWNLRVVTYVLPPEGLDLNSRLRFIEDNGGKVKHVIPQDGQPRRFCFGRNYIDNCTSTDNRYYTDCVDGPVYVVTYDRSKFLYFKNDACAACNGYGWPYLWKTALVCDPGLPQGFSLVFNLRDSGESSTTVVSKVCPFGTVYDENLKFCREGYLVSSSGELKSEYLVLLWLKASNYRTRMNSTLEDGIKSALVATFLFLENQITKIVLHKQDEANSILVATFRLTLTPFQSLLMANEHDPNMNVTRENTVFLKLLNSTGNFTLAWKEHSFSVVKLISKRLSCYGEARYQSHEYEIESGTLLVNKTGEMLLLKDYTVVQERGGNITLCRKLTLSNCNGSAYVPLAPSEYVIFTNLSIYHNATSRIFDFGEYLISENVNKKDDNISEASQNSSSSRNSTIAVCLPFRDTYSETKIRDGPKSTSYGVRIATLIAFIVSIICLILLLLTYGLFQELRTLPGLNLMNLAFSMLLSNLIWLIGTGSFEGEIVCEIFAILLHYLFQASFLAMSVISYHSCRVFSQPLAGRITNKWRKFFKYSTIVWLSPAVFVSVCLALDKTETFLVDYGKNCWIGTRNATLYLFLLPLALLLLYNISTFIQTAVSLSRHEKERKTLQRQEGKQNLLICIKLATLVGFPWLFAFFGVLFPDVEAFEYLFVVFVCLQGLYIAMAFLLNKKTLKLYKDRLNIGSTRTTSSNTRSTPALELS